MRAEIKGETDDKMNEEMEKIMINGKGGGDDGAYRKGYTYAYLKSAASNDAEDIDPTNKEQYLDDAEFEQIFKMTRQEFVTKPQWKKIELKKQVGLF